MDPPDQITRQNYAAWLKEISPSVGPNPFYDLMFDWYEEQLHTPLPDKVSTAPDKLFVEVDRALAQTIKLEQQGDIEEGNALGFDLYGQVDVSLSAALDTTLFYFGKPVANFEGETFPCDSVFSVSHSTIQQKWGAGAYLFRSALTNGGIVDPVFDDHSVLVRQSSGDSYVILSSFFGPTPGKETDTQAHFSIVMLKSLSASSTDFRHGLRRNGQSYKSVGLEFGRKSFGFNAARVHSAEKAFTDNMKNFQTTGKFKECRPR